MEDRDSLLQSGLWFGGRMHRVDTFTKISSDIFCTTCWYFGHVTLICSNLDRLIFHLCTNPHTTRND